jgi:hypothetical protein
MMEDQRALQPAMGGSEYVAGGSIQGQLVVAPPRVREPMIQDQNQRTAAVLIENEPDHVGYHATCHGITASPRVHQMLKDQREMVSIYPVYPVR